MCAPSKQGTQITQITQINAIMIVQSQDILRKFAKFAFKKKMNYSQGRTHRCTPTNNKNMKKIILALLLLKTFHAFGNEQSMVFTLQEVIELAQTQSPDILRERHNFRASYWHHVAHRAGYLPSLSFRSDPGFNRRMSAITQPDGTLRFVQQNFLRTDATFEISQAVPLTGGHLSLRSRLERLDQLSDGTRRYSSVPVIIAYSQTLFGVNHLRWNQRIEPLRFAEAKRRYVEALESVAVRAVQQFFGLAMAQTNLEIAYINLTNAEMLYLFAQGRYNIGTITENEMLQLEISRLIAENDKMNAEMNLIQRTQMLRNFLGIHETVPIEVVIESEVPLIIINEEEALAHTLANGSDILQMQRLLLESDRNVAQARATTGLRADLFLEFGLAQQGSTIEEAFQSPLDQQFVGVGIRLPILDWGRGRGQREMARSQRDLTISQIEQNRVNIEMNISRLVQEFNMQMYQLNVAARRDYTAERRGEITQRLFMLDRITVLELNTSIAERDTARRRYIIALQTYWELYYRLRSVTLFDFRQGIPIVEDYQLLIR